MEGTENTSPVDQAEQALREFGDLTYTKAAEMLSLWSGDKQLTVMQRAEVLRRFTNVDRVMKCADCGELIEHYAGEPEDLWHHLGWPEKPKHEIRTKLTVGGNVEVWCTCKKWLGEAPSERAAQSGWDRHVEAVKQ